MTPTRAAHLRLVTTEPAAPALRQPRLRFQPVVRLTDGAAFGIHAETDCAFEDIFRTRHLTDAAHPSAAAWFGQTLERAARLASQGELNQRPISITAPMAALTDPDMPMALEAACARAGILPQEIRIDFIDASVAALEDFALDQVDAIRARGFRVGLDARKSWRTPMGARARMTFEAIRLDPDAMDLLNLPVSRLEAAAAEGVAIIAENARWRDADRLAEMGVHFALAPRADS